MVEVKKLQDGRVANERQARKRDRIRNSTPNARLIAAAPDMLAELQRLYAEHGSQHTADIIAKATGNATKPRNKTCPGRDHEKP